MLDSVNAAVACMSGPKIVEALNLRDCLVTGNSGQT